MEITRLDATLGAVVSDIRLAELTDAEWTEIERTFHDHAVLVFPGQQLTSAEQISFAERFGSIEVLVDGYDAVPISTIDRTGEVMAPDHPVMQVVRGNQGWHTDSTYMPVSAKASVLSARVVPAVGGETEWADMRAAYEALDDVTRERISGLRAYHSIVYSQAKAGFTSTMGYGMDEPPQLRPLVKVHPVTARPALFIGRHAHAIPGLDPEESDRLLAQLLDDACRPPRVHRHRWQSGDVVVWDNRCVLHRACEWDLSQPRVMVHTRVAGDPATESAIAPV
ncbi:MAG TPA: TauD/TfdA family dioxygenase [Acidimicrobiales bacterium]|nr:TauD/TfdA family dioxygenase [Acidimicrobiales bacterium]